MTLDDLERQNRGLYKFFVDFGLRATFQKRTAPKPIEIYIDKHTQFLALNVDFNGLSRDFLCPRKPAHEVIKERYPVKVVIFPMLASLSWKRLQIGISMLPITTSTSDELFRRINIDDFETLKLQNKGF